MTRCHLLYSKQAPLDSPLEFDDPTIKLYVYIFHKRYFDVWAPEMATHYGQVFWTDQGSNPIPADIIKRFANKTMAIVGYEQDQVMVTPVGQPGVNPSQDVSVPINWASDNTVPPPPLSFILVVVRILIGDQTSRAPPTYGWEFGAPHQCLLSRSIASYLCRVILTCNIPMTHNTGRPTTTTTWHG